MHALLFDRVGGPDVLRWEEVADPIPLPGEALIRIRAAGLNFADIHRRLGSSKPA
jgi:NADPH2:quinone reductase